MPNLELYIYYLAETKLAKIIEIEAILVKMVQSFFAVLRHPLRVRGLSFSRPQQDYYVPLMLGFTTNKIFELYHHASEIKIDPIVEFFSKVYTWIIPKN